MSAELSLLDPHSRIGTSFAAVFAAFEEGDLAKKDVIIKSLQNTCACMGLAPAAWPGMTATSRQWHQFQILMDAVADAPSEQRSILTRELEEILVRYAPFWGARQLGAHKLWLQDPAEWARLMAIILEGMADDDMAATKLTMGMVQQFTAARGAGRN